MVEYISKVLDRTFGALADPTRRRILAQLAKGEECVTELARPHAISLAAVSKHLMVLEKAGLVRRRRQGRVHSLTPGARTMKEAQAGANRDRAVGEFGEVKAPERLVYTWDWEKDGSGAEFGEVEGKPSLITVEFLKRGEQTEFVLTHSRFASVESRDNHARGWGHGVDSFAK